MTVADKFLTAEDLWNLSDDGQRHELVKGEVRTMAPSGSAHGGFIVNLTAPLAQYVRSRKLGAVLGAETGFIIARQPDTVRAPDIAFIRADRIPAGGLPQKFFPGAPDLAVEVISPTDTLYDVEEKVEDWLTAGTALVWIVNPRRRTVTIYRPGKQPRVLAETDSLSGEEVIEGFAYPVRDIFSM